MENTSEQQLETESPEDQSQVDGDGGWHDLDDEAIAAAVAAEEAGEEEPDLEADDSSLPDSVRLYFNQITRHPLLSRAEEVQLAKLKDIYLPYKLSEEEGRGLSAEQRDLALWEKIKHLPLEERQQVIEGKKAFDRMVECNLRLVVSQAKRYVRSAPKLDLMDLCQEANLGLIRAVEKFDHRKGFKFSTYASWWIKQSCTRAVGNDGRTIRLPVNLSQALRKMRAVESRYVVEHGREATIDELARLLNITVDELTEIKRLPDDAASLNQHVGDDDRSELGDLLEDEQTAPIDAMIDEQLREALQQGLRRLPAFQARVLMLRWGLAPEGGFSERPRTIEDVSELLGENRHRVRGAELEALKTLQQDVMLKSVAEATEARDINDVVAEFRPSDKSLVSKKPKWTDEAIEQALREFIGKRTVFPSKTEFSEAGRVRLYNIAAATGGWRRWAVVLDVEPPRSRRHALPWAA